MDLTTTVGNQEEAQSNVAEAPAQTDPRDLSDAFGILRSVNQGAAQDDVEQPEPGQPDVPVDADADGAGSAGGFADAPDPDDGLADETLEDVGGYSIPDYDAVTKNIAKSVQQQAIRAAAETFEQNGIRKFTIADLYEKDEQRGTVSFRNPDDPSRPFSSRVEAMNWINSMNQAIDAEFKNMVNQNQRKFMQETAPSVRLMQFAPTYDTLDNMQKQYLDALIEPYGVVQNGKLVGYNCDLNAMARQAIILADKFAQHTAFEPDATSQAQQQMSGAAAQAQTPAMDMPSTGSQSTANSQPSEPKDLNDALRMYHEAKKNQQRK